MKKWPVILSIVILLIAIFFIIDLYHSAVDSDNETVLLPLIGEDGKDGEPGEPGQAGESGKSGLLGGGAGGRGGDGGASIKIEETVNNSKKIEAGEKDTNVSGKHDGKGVKAGNGGVGIGNSGGNAGLHEDGQDGGIGIGNKGKDGR